MRNSGKCGRFTQAYTYEEIFAFSQPLTVEGGTQLIRKRYNIDDHVLALPGAGPFTHQANVT